MRSLGNPYFEQKAGFAFVMSLNVGETTHDYATEIVGLEPKTVHAEIRFKVKKQLCRSSVRPNTGSTGKFEAIDQVVILWSASLETFLQPVQNFLLDPTYSVWTKLDTLRKLVCLLQPRDVLRRIKNKLFELAF